MKKVYVVDATALFLGIELDSPMFTTREAIEEILLEEEKIKLETLKTLKIREVPPTFLKKAEDMAVKVGEKEKLSKTDLSLLALSLYLRECGFEVNLVTEDFALQNAALHSKIKVLSVRDRKIPKGIIWEFYCPACGKRVESWVKICPICGTPIKRKPKRSSGHEW